MRALQEKEFRPPGSTRYVPLSARVIAASNRDLKTAQAEGTFRSDLYYRLNVLQIVLPPRRKRQGDFFLDRQREAGSGIVGLCRQAIHLMSCYQWPGNVRELENCILYSALSASGSTIEVADLPPDVRSSPGLSPELGQSSQIGLGYLQEVERKAVLEVLTSVNGNRLEAARRLGISKSCIYMKLKEYGIAS